MRNNVVYVDFSSKRIIKSFNKPKRNLNIFHKFYEKTKKFFSSPKSKRYHSAECQVYKLNSML